jgi:hypothetical protein
MAWIVQDAAGAKILVAVQCRAGADADLLESLRTVDPALQFTTKTQRDAMLAGTVPATSKTMGFLREDYQDWHAAFEAVAGSVVRVVANAPGFALDTVAMINRWNAAVPDSPILLVQAAPSSRRLALIQARRDRMSPPSGAELAARGAFLFPQRVSLTSLRAPTEAFANHLLTGAPFEGGVCEEHDLRAAGKRSRAGGPVVEGESEDEDDSSDVLHGPAAKARKDDTEMHARSSSSSGAGLPAAAAAAAADMHSGEDVGGSNPVEDD